MAEKVCVFLMLVPSAYMQSMSAFVAQNMGAQKPARAKKALGYGIITALTVGLVRPIFPSGKAMSSLLSFQKKPT